MTEALPKFRSDLVFNQQQSGGTTIYVVKEPVTGQFFRFGEAEQFIARQLDGVISIDALRQKVEGEFGATLPAETLSRFVNSLKRSGLLETEEAQQKKKRRRKRIQGNLLYLRCKLFDPDRLFSWLIGKVRFLFTPAFVILASFFILTASIVTVANWDDVRQDLPRLYSLSAVPVISLMIFLVITLHEFGHGLTCKYFGGEVHELGFLLIYFQPALFCNVSDAWLFPEKSKRMWVGFAGPFFEIFLWSLAVLTWRVTDVDTSINFLAFIVVASSGVKTLFNLNPLIKLDGYYLLSDYLELPNLRRKAFAYIGNGIKKLFGTPVDATPEIARRERRIYLAYGLVGTIGSFSIIGVALAKIGAFLIQQSQPMALALFAGLLGTKVRRRFRRLFGKGSDPSDFDDDDDDGTGSSETAPVAKTKSKKQPGVSRRRPILFFTLFVVGVAALFLVHRDLRIPGQFNILPIRNADVRAEIEGIIEEIRVDEGDQVREGDLIARISDRDLLAEFHRTQAEIQQMQAKLKMLEAGSTEDEIDVAKATVAKVENRLKFAEARLARDKKLFEQNLLSQKEYEDTQELASTSDRELAEAKSRLKLLQGGTRPEDIEVNRAELERLESRKKYLEEELRLVKVLSPATGIVTTPSRMLKEMTHQLVKRGDLIAKIFDFKTVTAEIVISEKDIGDVKVGQNVLVKARAYPDQTFHGTVTFIATMAQMSSSSGANATSASSGPNSPSTPYFSRATVTPKTILVTTEIDNSSMFLKPEMTGQAKIFCGDRRLIDLATRRMARTVKVEFWSWW